MTTAGSILGAAGLVPLLACSGLWVRRAGYLAWAIGSALVAASLLSSTVSHLVHHPVEGAAAMLAAVVVVVAGGYLAHRHPWWFLWAVVATAPARIPFSLGGASANLLVPLYVVIAAGAAAAGYELAIGRDRSPRLGYVGWALGAFVAWSGISMAWSVDRHHGSIEMLFFYLPFGFLTARLGQLRERPGGLRVALAVQVALAVVFGAVALWQELTRHLFWNDKIEITNAYTSYFRVNSLFWDSSIYARFMVVTLVLLAGVAVHRGLTLRLAVVMGWIFAATYFAYSQSALTGLAAGAVAIGASLWPRRLTVALSAAAGIVAAAGLAVVLASRHANRITSDRFHLIELSKRVVSHHPVLGAGLGGFARAAVGPHRGPSALATAQSHTTPLTVLAEQGPLGLVLYGALIAAAVVTALRPFGDRGTRLTLLAALITVLVSSLSYNAFFEDPATWILLALIAFVTAAPDPPERPA